MAFSIKPPSLVLSAWLLACWPANGEPLMFPPDELIHLLELCTRNSEPEELNEAMNRLTGKPSGIHPDSAGFYQNPEYAYLNIERAKRHGELILRELGFLLLDESSSLAGGLPSLEKFPHPERLGPLFAGMVPYFGDKTDLKITLGPLERHITGDWMDAAARCSAFDFIHSVRACRGQIGELLLTYQNSGDETGIIRLGEMVGLHPNAASVIRPGDFTSRSLALLLAGALGRQNRSPDELYYLLEMAATWERSHPSLFDEWSAMISNAAVLPWYGAVARFHRGERAEALLAISTLRAAPGILATLKPADALQSKRSLLIADQHKLGGFICSLLTSAACPEQELPALARVIPSDLLAAAIGRMLAYGSTDDEAQWRGVLLLPEMRTRKDLPEPLPIHISRRDAIEVAERWSKAGQVERSRRLLEATDFLKP